MKTELRTGRIDVRVRPSREYRAKLIYKGYLKEHKLTAKMYPWAHFVEDALSGEPLLTNK